jgi:hypothetical protein
MFSSLADVPQLLAFLTGLNTWPVLGFTPTPSIVFDHELPGYEAIHALSR